MFYKRGTFPFAILRDFLFFSFVIGVFSLPSVLLADSEKILVIALGDSTTAGTPAFKSPAEYPPAGQGNPESQYAHWLMKANPEWKVLNQGVNGERTDEILIRFKSMKIPKETRAVIVLAGVNDLFQGRTSDQVKASLNRLYDEIEKRRARILVCTILPYDFMSEEIYFRMKEVNAWIRDTARTREFAFCDTSRMVEDPNRPGRLAGSPDGLHPDAAGYRRMAEAIRPELEKLLEQAG